MTDRHALWQRIWPAGVPRRTEVTQPFTEYFRDQAEKRPDAIAIDFYGCEIAYGALNRMMDQLAHALIDRGLSKGDRVGIFLQNSPHYVISFFGIIRAGGIVVNLNPMFKAVELGPVIEKTGITLMIFQESLYPEVEKAVARHPVQTLIAAHLADFIPRRPLFSPPAEILEASDPIPGTIAFRELLNEEKAAPICRINDMDKDLAMLQLTGGTTGNPKAAMINVRSFTIAARVSMYWFGLAAADQVSLGMAPFFHIMGLQVTMAPTLLGGGKLVILSRFTPETVACVIAERRVTVWVAAPAMLIALVNLRTIKSFDLSSLRIIMTGGAPVSLSLQRRIETLAPHSQLGEGYGMTEVLAAGGTITPIGRWKPGVCGIPPTSDIKILDLVDGAAEMPLNKEGEIVIKGPTVMLGYWNQPEETRDVIRNGWFYTGDIGLLDEEGYLKIVDRKKELILCSGFNVYPSDLENTLARHPDILEVAVVGVPDTYRGESPKAYVVLREEREGAVTPEDILGWCRENMASYKRPREIEFRKSLPKSGAGKLLKRLLN